MPDEAESKQEMSKERQGEIALKILRRQLRKNGVKLNNDSVRELGNIAKELGIQLSDLKEFARIILEEETEQFVTEHLS